MPFTHGLEGLTDNEMQNRDEHIACLFASTNQEATDVIYLRNDCKHCWNSVLIVCMSVTASIESAPWQ